MLLQFVQQINIFSFHENEFQVLSHPLAEIFHFFFNFPTLVTNILKIRLQGKNLIEAGFFSLAKFFQMLQFEGIKYFHSKIAFRGSRKLLPNHIRLCRLQPSFSLVIFPSFVPVQKHILDNWLVQVRREILQLRYPQQRPLGLLTHRHSWLKLHAVDRTPLCFSVLRIHPQKIKWRLRSSLKCFIQSVDS